MSLFDKIQSMIDQSGDGRIGFEDLEALRSGENGGAINELESIADHNQDGKLGMEDIQNLDAGGLLDEIKNRFL